VVTLETLRHDADTRSIATQKDTHVDQYACKPSLFFAACLVRVKQESPLHFLITQIQSNRRQSAYGSCALRVSKCPRQPIDAVMSLAASVA